MLTPRLRRPGSGRLHRPETEEREGRRIAPAHSSDIERRNRRPASSSLRPSYFSAPDTTIPDRKILCEKKKIASGMIRAMNEAAMIRFGWFT